ncbi:hypothetical protein J4212_05050 [Candidatus Woesearchaeota archaeon]|nr:hypothetical protein [Candidatus Woesearchaeota archaeon]
MEKGLRFSFDKEAGILDISIGSPKKAASRGIQGDFFIGVGPKTKGSGICGFTE